MFHSWSARLGYPPLGSWRPVGRQWWTTLFRWRLHFQLHEDDGFFNYEMKRDESLWKNPLKKKTYFPCGMYCQMASKNLHTMEQRSIQYREHLNPVLNIWYNQCLSHIVGGQIKSITPKQKPHFTWWWFLFPIETDSSNGTIVSDKNEATTWRIWNSSVIHKVARGLNGSQTLT